MNFRNYLLVVLKGKDCEQVENWTRTFKGRVEANQLTLHVWALELVK